MPGPSVWTVLFGGETFSRLFKRWKPMVGRTDSRPASPLRTGVGVPERDVLAGVPAGRLWLSLGALTSALVKKRLRLHRLWARMRS